MIVEILPIGCIININGITYLVYGDTWFALRDNHICKVEISRRKRKGFNLLKFTKGRWTYRTSFKNYILRFCIDDVNKLFKVKNLTTLYYRELPSSN